MGLDRTTRRQNLQKIWEESAEVQNKITETRIVDVGRLSVASMKKTNKIVLVNDELVGTSTDPLNRHAILVVAEFPGLTVRSISNAVPMVVVNGPTTLIPTPSTPILHNFYYTWTQLQKKNEEGEIESESMQFKGWVNCKIGSPLQPVTLQMYITFYNWNFYNEIQINKT